MLSTWFNVNYVIYSILAKPNAALKTVFMNIYVLNLTLLVVISIPRFRNHFYGSNHPDTQMLLIPIEKLSNERDSFRKAREVHIVYKAKTLEPLGI